MNNLVIIQRCKKLNNKKFKSISIYKKVNRNLINKKTFIL